MAAPAMPRNWQEEEGTYIRLLKRCLGGGEVGHPTRGRLRILDPPGRVGVVGFGGTLSLWAEGGTHARGLNGLPRATPAETSHHATVPLVRARDRPRAYCSYFIHFRGHSRVAA